MLLGIQCRDAGDAQKLPGGQRAPFKGGKTLDKLDFAFFDNVVMLLLHLPPQCCLVLQAVIQITHNSFLALWHSCRRAGFLHQLGRCSPAYVNRLLICEYLDAAVYMFVHTSVYI